MVDTLAAICLTLWALGLALSYSMGGFIHLLLAFGLIVVLSRLQTTVRLRWRLPPGAAEHANPEAGGDLVPQRQAGRVVMQVKSLHALPLPAAAPTTLVGCVEVQEEGRIADKQDGSQRTGLQGTAKSRSAGGQGQIA